MELLQNYAIDLAKTKGSDGIDSMFFKAIQSASLTWWHNNKVITLQLVNQNNVPEME